MRLPDPEGNAAALRQNLSRSLARLAGATLEFNTTFNTASTNVSAQLLIDPAASAIETWESLVTAMQVGSAMFTVANAPAGTMVDCRIGHEDYSFPATGPAYYTSAGNWLSAFWYAIICREQNRITELAAVPLELLRSSGGEYDEYIYDWVNTLQTYWNESPRIAEKLTAALEGSNPEIATMADRETLDCILYPPINLFYHFLRQDHAGFNQALAEALELHRLYWTSGDRESYFTGNLALGPLAMTCLAIDAGFPIDVESEYIPSSFVNREWLGAFPT
ncbi:immunity 49 family protein [Nocardia sp. IBHARD005]|uniref:immunity 49 family protein n=1 Tax=Nocardia sp. IBHARD005 TaxID=3457765 RepID=UPI004058BA50